MSSSAKKSAPLKPKPAAAGLPAEPMARLRAVMAWLRDPERGCPWDLEQNFATIAPYTLEEAYEVADAIARNDLDDLREELGDLLLQVVYHAQMAHEAGAFDFDAVARTIADKMIARHPHVFGAASIASAEQQTQSWEAQKAAERAAKGIKNGGTLDGIALALPALMRAEKLQKRAARVGFDWGHAEPVLNKIQEEIAELRQELAVNAPQDRLTDELGDVLFAVVNLARHCKVDAETALRATNAKFEQRFRFIEEALAARGRKPADASLDEMETLWLEAKKAERS